MKSDDNPAHSEINKKRALENAEKLDHLYSKVKQLKTEIESYHSEIDELSDRIVKKLIPNHSNSHVVNVDFYVLYELLILNRESLILSMMKMIIQMMKAVMIMIHLSLKRLQLRMLKPTTVVLQIMLKEAMLQLLLVAKVVAIAEAAVAEVIMIKSMILMLLIKIKKQNPTQHSKANCLKRPQIS